MTLSLDIFEVYKPTEIMPMLIQQPLSVLTLLVMFHHSGR